MVRQDSVYAAWLERRLACVLRMETVGCWCGVVGCSGCVGSCSLSCLYTAMDECISSFVSTARWCLPRVIFRVCGHMNQPTRPPGSPPASHSKH